MRSCPPSSRGNQAGSHTWHPARCRPPPSLRKRVPTLPPSDKRVITAGSQEAGLPVPIWESAQHPLRLEGIVPPSRRGRGIYCICRDKGKQQLALSVGAGEARVSGGDSSLPATLSSWILLPWPSTSHAALQSLVCFHIREKAAWHTIPEFRDSRGPWTGEPRLERVRDVCRGWAQTGANTKKRAHTASLRFKIHGLKGQSKEIAGWWSPGAGGGGARMTAIGVRVSFWGDEDGL